MSKKTKKYNQSNLFEFKPNNSISEAEILELANLIRIGVSGEILDKASEQLKKHFIEVKKAA
ncbi:MAG: hypothetical protein ABFD50_21085 [Smithella sp.]